MSQPEHTLDIDLQLSEPLLSRGADRTDRLIMMLPARLAPPCALVFDLAPSELRHRLKQTQEVGDILCVESPLPSTYVLMVNFGRGPRELLVVDGLGGRALRDLLVVVSRHIYYRFAGA